MSILYKNCANTFKDVDTKSGIIKGYASAFGNKDSDNDVIKSGAYTKTIKENAERIAVLYQHNINSPIAKNNKLYEDSYGLGFEATLSKSQLGKDVAVMIDEGIIREVSVGFQTLKGEDKKGFYEIQEVKLYEYSLVTIAANPMAIITGMKSAQEIQDELVKRIESLQNYIRKGSVSDETFKMLEFELANIKELTTLEIEPVKPLPKDEPSLFDFNKFNNFLKS